MQHHQVQQWCFLAPDGAQQGPVTTETVLKMLGSRVLDGTSFVWNPTMEEWKALRETELAQYAPSKWMYLDAAGAQLGPVDEISMQSALRKGSISPGTMVWTEGMAQWAALAQVPTLMERLQREPAAATSPVGGSSPRRKSAAVFAKPLPRPTSASGGGQSTTPPSGAGAGADGAPSTKRPRAADGADAAVAGEKQQPRKRKKKKKKKRKKLAPLTMIYVTNLPADVTEAEVAGLFGKYGIMHLGDEGEPKVKLYRDEAGRLKGDGTVHYLKDPSVDLAIQLADGMVIRGSTIGVERAQRKAAADPSLEKTSAAAPAKKKKVLTKQEARLRQLRREYQERALGWGDGVDVGIKVVVLFNAFDVARLRTLTLADDETKRAAYIEELSGDIREGCDELGDLKKVTVCDQSDEGVILVTYRNGTGAAACVERMNGRFFDGRKLRVELWDGFSNFVGVKAKETEAAQKERLASFGDWLEGTGSASDDDDDDGGGSGGGGGGSGGGGSGEAASGKSSSDLAREIAPRASPAVAAALSTSNQSPPPPAALIALKQYLHAVRETVDDPMIQVRNAALLLMCMHNCGIIPFAWMM